MTKIVRKSPARRPAQETRKLAANVREVLLDLGGQAHRSLVIEQIALRLGHDPKRVPADLRAALIRSFEDALRDERRCAAYGFHLPFGEGSHRWAVQA